MEGPRQIRDISAGNTYSKSKNRVDFVAGSVKSQSLASPVAHLPTRERYSPASGGSRHMGVVGISGRGAQLRILPKRVTKCRQRRVGVQASTWRLGQGCKCDILWDHVTLVDRSVVNLRRALHLVAWLETRPEARMRAQTVVQERLRDIESHCASQACA